VDLSASQQPARNQLGIVPMAGALCRHRNSFFLITVAGRVA
jgi:hypothetical protein